MRSAGFRRWRHIQQVLQSQPAIDDVFDDQHTSTFDVLVQILENSNRPGAGDIVAIAGHGHEVDLELGVHRPHQVGHERDRARQDSDE